MTKSLTDKFQDGSFEFGVYYCKTKEDGILKLELFHEGDGHGYAYCYGEEECYRYEDIEEVLAPVPSYDEWKEITESEDQAHVHLQDEREKNMCLEGWIENLEKQLKEANQVIKKYMSVAFGIRSEEEKPTVLQLAFYYLTKWGVK